VAADDRGAIVAVPSDERQVRASEVVGALSARRAGALVTALAAESSEQQEPDPHPHSAEPSLTHVPTRHGRLVLQEASQSSRSVPAGIATGSRVQRRRARSLTSASRSVRDISSQLSPVSSPIVSVSMRICAA